VTDRDQYVVFPQLALEHCNVVGAVQELGDDSAGHFSSSALVEPAVQAGCYWFVVF
jgi:hypothetical protein